MLQHIGKTVLLKLVVHSLLLFYNRQSIFLFCRRELIGDISKDQEALYQHIDVEGSNELKASIKEQQASFFKKT